MFLPHANAARVIAWIREGYAIAGRHGRSSCAQVDVGPTESRRRKSLEERPDVLGAALLPRSVPGGLRQPSLARKSFGDYQNSDTDRERS